MELLELLTTIETKNINEITFEGVDVKPLNDFILEFGISYSTLDEADNDLGKMKELYLENDCDEDERESIEEEYNQIIEDFGDIANEEVFSQAYEVDNGQINIKLS
ncbi:hypothetical protein [Staphylococcus equorum]|uniref:Uncharacterized protein n=1 Tax=Staphylococcus equorum TaxID=246432 RepID=A0AAP7IGN6_9STAP|nr:hypothetical protein [Staphylococcus equorum]OEK59121.1 hypothetical protein ASS94_00205 [Staphylococcus equorum]